MISATITVTAETYSNLSVTLMAKPLKLGISFTPESTTQGQSNPRYDWPIPRYHSFFVFFFLQYKYTTKNFTPIIYVGGSFRDRVQCHDESFLLLQHNRHLRTRPLLYQLELWELIKAHVIEKLSA